MIYMWEATAKLIGPNRIDEVRPEIGSGLSDRDAIATAVRLLMLNNCVYEGETIQIVEVKKVGKVSPISNAQ